MRKPSATTCPTTSAGGTEMPTPNEQWQGQVEEIAARVKRTESKLSRLGDQLGFDLSGRGPNGERTVRVDGSYLFASDEGVTLGHILREIHAAGAFYPLNLYINGEAVAYIDIDKGLE